MKNDTSAASLLCRHVFVLFAGFLIGLGAALLVAGTSIDLSQELRQARELGITSLTILSGYAKKRDVLNYVATLAFPILFAVGLWLVWVRMAQRRDELIDLFSPESKQTLKTASWRWLLAAVTVGYLFFSFNVNRFYVPVYNPLVGAWPFLGEEGENLGWIQSILNGGVYGNDFHCLYGPMLLYPLAWLMKVTGPSVTIARQYTYALDLAAYGIILIFLYRSMRTKTGFVFAAIGYFLIFGQSEKHLLAPNMTYLRVALGVLPIFLIFLYQERKDRKFVVSAGVVLGQSLLFSQEVGICSTFASLAMLVATPRPDSGISEVMADIGRLLGGIFISMLPMLLYFAKEGAMGALMDNLTIHPHLLGLGFTALPFPALNAFLLNPLGDGLHHYWVILVYIASAIYLIPLLLLGRRDRYTVLKSAILLFGALLFRAALSRSDQYHIFFVSQPAVLLLFLMLDSALVPEENQAGRIIVARVAVVAVIIGTLSIAATNTSFANVPKEGAYHWQSLTSKFKRTRSGIQVPRVPRADVEFDPETAGSIYKIDYFLSRYTQQKEKVFFFPNEAAYYFIFNRNNPTRYVLSCFAATRSQRLELIGDLEKVRPQYVVYSLKTWRVDRISERLQSPEVFDYLIKNYDPVESYPDVIFLKRKPRSFTPIPG